MSTILSLPRSFSTTLSKVTAVEGQTIGSGFTTVSFNTKNSDSGNNFNLVNGLYTVPSNGLYQITGTLRSLDQTPAGVQYGLGVHSSNDDGDWFLWHAVQNTLNVERRTTYPYIRTDFFAAGQQLRMFSYSSQSYTVSSAVLNIFRIA